MTANLIKKNGKYHVVISYMDDMGKRKQKWVSTRLDVVGNKRRAEAIMHPEQNVMFADYLENWLENLRPSLQITTYSSYVLQVDRINRHFRKKRIKLVDLKPYHIQEFYSTIMKKGKGSDVCLKFHGNIRKCLQSAVKADIIPSNPADKIDRPKAPKRNTNYLNLEQLKRLFEVSKYNRYDYIYKITAIYGLRRSELLGIKWSAIDFENNILKVNHTVVEITLDGKRICVGKDVMKNKSSNRVYPLLPFVKEMFLREKEKQEANKQLYGNSYGLEDKDYVFVNDLGKRLSGTYVTRNFTNILAEAQLPKIRFHELRHSCASLLLALGMSMKQVQEWLGHSTYQTTADIYAHLDYSSKLSVASGLMNVFGTVDQKAEQQRIIEEEKQRRMGVLNNTQPNIDSIKNLFSDNTYEHEEVKPQKKRDDFDM